MSIPVRPLEGVQGSPRMKDALTPPTSEEWSRDDGFASELSDIDFDEDHFGEIKPDHYFEDGKIPVFKPTMEQFRSFKDFISKIDRYGMKSGIVKVIPPKEWTDSLPALDQAVKSIKVKNPITQEFVGTHGTYTQANIEKQRSYNLPQWKALTEESQHQPPAKRGERRLNQSKVAKPTVPRSKARQPHPVGEIHQKRGPGRPRKLHNKKKEMDMPSQFSAVSESSRNNSEELTTLTNPSALDEESNQDHQCDEPNMKTGILVREDPSRTPVHPRRRQNLAGKTKSISERRKYNLQETADSVDEGAFEQFDYRFHGHEEYTAARCRELETLYWKSLTFAPPMYGADMPGSLFDGSTTSWNVARLENLLDVLGQKIPGVNTAYLYLGMWKATFAWHLEDVDLYSINFIHFGAPKQWYSISQEDARRFENAMKSVWPTDAKNCSQFLRHKTYLISPSLLQSQFNIRVNRLVHYEGEFVITFPYGYHSGYNLGYNCAESVNFATEAWLEYGKIAKKCDCEADSVWVNVEEIQRKLRGEPTPEYYEETDDEDNETVDGRISGLTSLPSPPASILEKCKQSNRKRKLAIGGTASHRKSKKIKIRIKTEKTDSCVLCPNDSSTESLIRTEVGLSSHRSCALLIPETYISDDENGSEIVKNIGNIDKARLGLKCSYCRSKSGACFQCSHKKCTRAFHATCAAPAGVQVDHGHIPVYGEEGTEYLGEAYDFRCRFHRAKRLKTSTCDSLESSTLIQEAARCLVPNQVAQFQHLQGEIFAGVVVENRISERTLLIKVLPHGDQIELDWKWLLKLEPRDSHLPKPSKHARPLPSHLSKRAPHSNSLEFGPPVPDDPFGDPQFSFKWAEFNAGPPIHNSLQSRASLNESGHIWYYLGEQSTEARALYTENPFKRVSNQAANFLESTKLANQCHSTKPHRPLGISLKADLGHFNLLGSKAPLQQLSYVAQRRPITKTPGEHNMKVDVGRESGTRESSLIKFTTDLEFSDKSNQAFPDIQIHSGYRESQNGITHSIHTEGVTIRDTIAPSSELRTERSTAEPEKNLRVGALSQSFRLSAPSRAVSNASKQTILDQSFNTTGGYRNTIEAVAALKSNVHTSFKSHEKSAVISNTNIFGGDLLWNISHCSNASRPNYIGHVARYPYLLNSLLRQPMTYKSPYTSIGD